MTARIALDDNSPADWIGSPLPSALKHGRTESAEEPAKRIAGKSFVAGADVLAFFATLPGDGDGKAKR
jgi:hypothetical protein